MNDKKIAFIYCINNRDLHLEAVRYLKSLNIPVGYHIEFVPIENAPNISSGYYKGMLQTDAKYKIYLHEDLLIINKNFLNDIISLFKTNSNLGVIGVVGAKTIPNTMKWRDSTQIFGKVFDNHLGKMKSVNYKEVKLDYESVQVVDGCIMATQYDIKWRNDLIADCYYYNVALCQEFLLAGFDVGVAHQTKPWCLHNCGLMDQEDVKNDMSSTFRNVYGSNIIAMNNEAIPLVSILIPTYNRPFYFELALQSALNQTYENIEIIICDDSSNDVTQNIIEKYKSNYKNIVYIKNPVTLGQFENDIKLFNLAKGEYINYLMDDDLFDHEKIEVMMQYFINDINKDITLITSNRKMIDKNGQQIKDNNLTRSLFENDTVIDGKELGNLILKFNFNCIGEPTTVLFRKKDLKESFGTFLGRKYGCNVDLATWLTLLSEGNAVYISKTLSYFRIHEEQQLQSAKMLLSGALDYAHEVLFSREKGFLGKKDDYFIALKNCRKYLLQTIEKLCSEAEMDRNPSFIKLLDYFKNIEAQLKGENNKNKADI